MPCKNAKETISRAIASIVEQKGLFSVRLHVQDGASTDGTVEIIKGWAEALSRGYALQFNAGVYFSWDSSSDNGMYDAISKGVRKLAPPAWAFMGWLNADDKLQPSACSFLASLEGVDAVDWVTGESLRIDLDGNTIAHMPHAVWPRVLLAVGVCDGRLWHCLQQEGTFWRKSLWDKAGGLNINFRLAGDWDLWRRFAMHAEVAHAPLPLAAFCQHDGQLSRRLWKNYCEEVDKTIPLAERRRSIKSILLDYKKVFSTAHIRQVNNFLFLQYCFKGVSIKNFIILTFASFESLGRFLIFFRCKKEVVKKKVVKMRSYFYKR
jgi:glycosyltransferase involved in cell wall biosynthesis